MAKAITHINVKSKDSFSHQYTSKKRLGRVDVIIYQRKSKSRERSLLQGDSDGRRLPLCNQAFEDEGEYPFSFEERLFLVLGIFL